MEFLSTEVGREQWRRYAANPDVALTITISEERGEGAATSEYRWNDEGRLLAVTISLGSQMDKGYPNRVNYPVLNSLAPMESVPHVSGSVLAATKIAHEFGHVNRAASADPTWPTNLPPSSVIPWRIDTRRRPRNTGAFTLARLWTKITDSRIALRSAMR